MKSVGEIVSKKPAGPLFISPDSQVLEALNLLSAHNLGAIPVMDGGRLVGTFSERDFARAVAREKRTPQETMVKEVMSIDALTVSAETGVEECLSLMNRNGVTHLPVIQGSMVLGVVSILEVVDAVLAERDSMIHRLEKYVSETWPI